MTNKLTNQPDVISNGEEEYTEEQKMTRSQYTHDKAALEAAIKGSDAAQRLFVNPDFKMLIVEGYFQKEPTRLVGMLASEKLADDNNRRVITEDLMAIGKLKNLMSQMVRNGEGAKAQLQELENYVSQYGIREI